MVHPAMEVEQKAQAYRIKYTLSIHAIVMVGNLTKVLVSDELVTSTPPSKPAP